MWPLSKFLFLGCKSMWMPISFILVKIFWAHPSSIEKGVRFAEKVDGLPIIYCIEVQNQCKKAFAEVPPSKTYKVKNFWNRFNCAPAKWALEKERRREGECLTLPLNLFKKQWPYLFLLVVTFHLADRANPHGLYRLFSWSDFKHFFPRTPVLGRKEKKSSQSVAGIKTNQKEPPSIRSLSNSASCNSIEASHVYKLPKI